jgi:hypothetical protein
LILASISREGESAPFAAFAPLFVFFTFLPPARISRLALGTIASCFAQDELLGLGLHHQSPKGRLMRRYGDDA